MTVEPTAGRDVALELPDQAPLTQAVVSPLPVAP